MVVYDIRTTMYVIRCPMYDLLVGDLLYIYTPALYLLQKTTVNLYFLP